MKNKTFLYSVLLGFLLMIVAIFFFGRDTLSRWLLTSIAPIQEVSFLPIAHLTFDEGSGTTARDSSPMANQGVLLNGTGWTAGIMGEGLTVDGGR